MNRKIILTEEQLDYVLNEVSNLTPEFPIMEENLKYCYIGSFFVFELKGFPNIKGQNKGSVDKADELSEERVGNFLGTAQYDVFVYSNDGGSIPHVHILDHSTLGENFDCCVRLDVPEYFSHGHHENTFNSRQKKAFNKFMHEIKKARYFTGTNYDYAVMIWDDNNSNVSVNVSVDENGERVIPDYSLLK